VTKAVQSLPFQLTDSQMHCFDEIWNDAIVSNDGRMTRLLQGDVGSGKTVLGYLTGLGCIESWQGGGSVAAILAPTQLLALQHYKTISDFAHAFNEQSADTPINNIRVELLTGSVVGSKREEVLSRLENTDCPDADFLIGTHALVATDVVERLRNLRSVYQSNGRGLALSIVDEEQRFGVNQ
jgi:ATP-dependent DNA helicase RecG